LINSVKALKHCYGFNFLIAVTAIKIVTFVSENNNISPKPQNPLLYFERKIMRIEKFYSKFSE
jgi:hypothetical protein